VGELSHLTDMLGQPGLVARRRLFVDQTVAGGFVDQRSSSLQFAISIVTTGSGPDVFDSLTQLGTVGPIAQPLGFRGLHALGAGFMIRQDNTFRVFSNKSAKKYNRHFALVNQ